jgi:hypothetical protein
VVLRAFSDALADNLVTLFGIHTAFSTSAAAAPPSSSGLGHHPFKVEIAGSNPAGGTI